MIGLVAMLVLAATFALGAFRSATGGNIILPGPIQVPNGKWTGTWRTALANVTQSDADNCELYFPTNQSNSWTFSCVRDDTAFPSALGLGDGTIISLMYFKLGAGAKADQIVNTTVEENVVECDPMTNEVVRVTVSGKGGRVTKNVTPPS